MDFACLDWIQEKMRSPSADRFMSAVSTAGDGWFWLSLGLALCFMPGLRPTGLQLLLSLALHFLICNMLLKPLFRRERPFRQRPDIVLCVREPRDYSFPSGHSCSSIAAATVLGLCASPLFIPALIFALLIAFSRIYLYVHFPSDIIGGLVLGTALGYVAHLSFLELF